MSALRFAFTSALGCLLVLLGASRALAKDASDSLEACASAAERGQVARHAGKLLDARAEFRRCEALECPSVVRTDCSRWNAELEEETPSVVLRAHDARGQDVIDVRVSANDRIITDHLDGEPIALDPGRYDFRYRAPSGAVAMQTVLLALGERRREITGTFAAVLGADGTEPRLPPPPRPMLAKAVQPSSDDGRRAPSGATSEGPLAYAFAGVSAISLGVFGYFEVVGQSGYSDLENGCGRTHSCLPAQVDPVRTDFVAAASFLAVGVVFAGLATWQFLTPRHPASAAWLRTPAAPARGWQTPLIRF